jgi:hypothetical protein
VPLGRGVKSVEEAGDASCGGPVGVDHSHCEFTELRRFPEHVLSEEVRRKRIEVELAGIKLVQPSSNLPATLLVSEVANRCEEFDRFLFVVCSRESRDSNSAIRDLWVEVGKSASPQSIAPAPSFTPENLTDDLGLKPLVGRRCLRVATGREEGAHVYQQG